MRILVVTSAAPWLLSHGNGLILHHHIRILAPHHEIEVLVAGDRRDARRHDVRVGESPADRLPEGVGVRVFAASAPPALDYAWRRIRSERTGEPAQVFWVERPALVDALTQSVARRPPDLIHLHGWGTAQLWRMVGGLPTLHMAIDAWSLGARNRLLPWWRRLTDAGQAAKIEAHERRHYPRCGAVVVVSRRDGEHLASKVGRARVEVVPNGVDAERDPPPPSSDPVLAFHGVFSTAANRDAARVLAREILPEVRRLVPSARLLIIGREVGPETGGLAGDGIEVTGEVPEVGRELERVAVYVAPLVSGTGIKNKVLEAMAAGLPVVGTPLALEGIGPGPGVRQAATPQEMAREIAVLLGSADIRRAEGEAALARVRTEFTWERSAGAIESLWRELSAARR